MTGIIEKIMIYPAKGGEGKELREARLIENFGFEGDFHAGSERQLSLLSAESREELKRFTMAHNETGLCFSRFRENITVSGISPNAPRPGMYLAAGEAVIEISADSKRCHDECPVYKKGLQCPLAGKNLFAKVIKSGIIRIGDNIAHAEDKMAAEFSHFDSCGNAVMVDVSQKEVTIRTALAKGSISMSEETLKAVLGGTAKKGDVFGVARIGGIMAAKRCSQLIPLCHSLNFDKCAVDFFIDENKKEIEASCEVKLSGKTGAEMEALTGASIALLTIYDMCKALDRTMVIGNIRLCEKTGGKSGVYCRNDG